MQCCVTLGRSADARARWSPSVPIGRNFHPEAVNEHPIFATPARCFESINALLAATTTGESARYEPDDNDYAHQNGR
jgi:hypothetical protein